jgi:23S rRNA pseudouridine2604 synthase
VTEIFLNGMASGVRILGTVTKPCRVQRIAPATFRIVLTQGLNRQIRRMCSFFGYKVTRLQRVRIMNITLGALKVGQWRELRRDEVQELLSRAGVQRES